MLKKLLSLTILLLLIIPSPAFATDDPVVYWKFDEGSGLIATDSSGNGVDGILTAIIVGSPTYSTNVAPVNLLALIVYSLTDQMIWSM